MKYDAILAGLLHDIGKFFQRAHDDETVLGSSTMNMEHQLCPSKSWGYSHRHVLFSYEFITSLCDHLPDGIEKEKMALAASGHHKPENDLQKILQKADVLSSGMKRASEEKPDASHFRSTPLKAITSSINIGKEIPRNDWYHRLKPLDPAVVFPFVRSESSPLTCEYRELWESFVSAWNNNTIRDPRGYINRALTILERYTWCIPSATYKVVPDISLFDHSKTTAAIAACLQEAGHNSSPFLFVAGDFSGIQDYIFSITKEGGGYAKRLRARSFYISLLSEAITLKILQAAGLPLTQRIIHAGGKFVLLLPNTEAISSILQSTLHEIETWLLRKTDGDIRFVFITLSSDNDGMMNFDKTLDSLSDNLREMKNAPFKDVLTNGDTWNVGKFLRPAIVESERGVCATCGRHPARHLYKGDTAEEEAAYICDLCRFDFDLGRKLPKSEWVSFSMSGPGYEILPGIYCDLCQDVTDMRSYKVLLLKNIAGAIDAPPDMPISSAFTARHIPMAPNNTAPLTFDDIAKKATGIPRLAYLKGDVDNLGYIFRNGFQRQQPDRDDTASITIKSISRITGLSRMLDVFFAGYVNHLLESDSYRSVYTVYAGGDDFLCIGPWNVMIDLASRLEEDFRDYCCHNPNWSLSMGLTLAGAHTPVLNAVDMTDDYLKSAKLTNYGNSVPLSLKPLPDKAPGKNSFALFDTCIPWEQFGRAYEKALELAGWIADGTLTTAHAWRLRRYSELYRQFVLSRDTKCLEYIPLIAYDLRRNWKEGKMKIPKEWVQTLNKHPDVDDMKTLKFICEYALLTNRGRQEGGDHG